MLALRKVLFGITFALSGLSASSALAAGGGHGEPHVTNWFSLPMINIELSESIHAPALGWVMVSFAVYVGIIVFIMSKKLPDFLAQRSELIRQAIDEASEAKKEAEANARKYEERMAKLDEELKQMREDFSTQGQTEFERIEQSAESAAQKMQKDTEATIDAELQKALAQLQTETAKLSYDLAKEQLEKSLNASDQARLEETFLEDLNRQAQA